jgi:hypothetical protein
MYTCLVRVRHASPHGEAYTRTHVVPVRTTLRAAVLACGAVPPRGATASLSMGPPMPTIVYTDDVLPICMDPGWLVLDLVHARVFVHVPYQCTYEHLTCRVIPAKLLAIGVHPQEVHGALSASAAQLWSGAAQPADLHWTKLRRRVAFRWPPTVLRGVCRLQQLYRAQKEWCVL